MLKKRVNFALNFNTSVSSKCSNNLFFHSGVYLPHEAALITELEVRGELQRSVRKLYCEELIWVSHKLSFQATISPNKTV